MNFRLFVLVLSVVCFILLNCTSADESIIVIPEGYVGPVLVVFGQKNGETQEYLKGKRLYRINEDGLLKSQFDSNDGWSEVPSFYYSQVLKENKIPFVGRTSRLPIDKIVAHGGVVGSYKKMKFVQYFIGNKEDIFLAYDSLNSFNFDDL